MYKVAIFISRDNLRQAVVQGLAEAGCTLLVPKRHDDWLEFVCSHRPQFVFIEPDSRWVEIGDLTSTLAGHDGLSEIKVIAVVDEQNARRVEADWKVSDVVFAPFAPVEMATRMDLAMWRDGQPSAEDILAAGDLAINLATYEVTVEGEPIQLTFKEYELLRFLVSHPSAVHSRNALLNHVWGYDYYGGTRTVDVHIRRLREKLGLAAAERIETVRNVGYRFRA